MSKNHIDIVEAQETWELLDSRIYVPGYKWFGNPRKGIKGDQGVGGVGLLVRERLIDDGTIIKEVKCIETIWLRIKIKKG